MTSPPPPTLRARRRPPPTSPPSSHPTTSRPRPPSPRTPNPPPARPSSFWSDLSSLASSLSTSTPTPRLKPPKLKAPGWLSDFLTIPPPPPGRGPAYNRPRRRPDHPDSDCDEPPPPENGDDIPVYVLPVTPATTLEGLAIALNTTTETIRRANGLWPGDRPQMREELLVAVSDCGARGVPEVVEGGEVRGERGYRVEGRVRLPGLGDVLVARLPRRKLSYFPPRRRARRREPEELFDAHGRLREEHGPVSPVLPGMEPGVRSLRGVEDDGTEEIRRAVGEVVRGAGEVVRGAGEVTREVERWVGQWVREAGREGGEMYEMVSQSGGEDGRGGANGVISARDGGQAARRREGRPDAKDS